MFLDASKIPELYRLLASGKPEVMEKIRGADISLTVSLFFALAHQTAVKEGDRSLWKAIDELGLAGVERGVRCLSFDGEQCSPDPFGAPAHDIHRIASEADLTSQEWVLFYDRFRRSASGKRKSPMFRGVGGILGEMGDNVVSHAYEAENKPCLAVAGFQVDGHTASFCVADFGQGFLKSLYRSEKWSGLSTADALRKAYKLRQDTRILLVGVDDDEPLETFWSMHRLYNIAGALFRLKLLGVTVPNFSFFTSVPRFQILRNRKRILLSAERLSGAGVPVSIHLNANTDGDWKFWMEFLREHTECSVVTMEFQTGARALQEIGREAFDELVLLQDRIGRPLHPILVGAARFFKEATDKFNTFTVIDSQPFLRALSRQTLVLSALSQYKWKETPTETGEPLDKLIDMNLLHYEEKMLAGSSDDEPAESLPDPKEMFFEGMTPTPYFTAQPVERGI